MAAAFKFLSLFIENHLAKLRRLCVKDREGEDMRLELILNYNMDEGEARAYRLALIWFDKSRKTFPDYKHAKMAFKSDPRKCLIFKVCYKFQRETIGILDEADFPLYVRAQLEVLKHLSKNRKDHVLIDPNCLVGDKAWNRWKLWKRKYDAATAKPSELPQNIAPGVVKALDGLERTREFFAKTFGEPIFEKYQEAYTNKNLFRWINIGKISPYYLAISPYIARVMQPDDLKRLNFDVDMYKPCITDEVTQKFNKLFGHENEKS